MKRDEYDLIYPQGPNDHDGILKYANSVGKLIPLISICRAVAQRNILYYAGYQWIKYDSGIRGYRPVAMKRTTPRPVTNKVPPASTKPSPISSCIGPRHVHPSPTSL